MARRLLYVIGGIAAVAAGAVGVYYAMKTYGIKIQWPFWQKQQVVPSMPAPQPFPVPPLPPLPVVSAGLVVFDMYVEQAGDVIVVISFKPVNDFVSDRYAGAWLDIDYGPDFRDKGQANLGFVSGPITIKTITFRGVSVGRHKLYVRVSAPQGYQWDICAAVGDNELGCKRTA
jgi:hypothetical protein